MSNRGNDEVGLGACEEPPASRPGACAQLQPTSRSVRSAGSSRLYADDRGGPPLRPRRRRRPWCACKYRTGSCSGQEKSCRGLWRRRASVGLSGVAPGDSNKLIVTPGGADATLVALDRMTGAVVWKGKVPQEMGLPILPRLLPRWRTAAVHPAPGAGVVGYPLTTGGFSGATTHRPTISASTAAPHLPGRSGLRRLGYNTGGGLAKLLLRQAARLALHRSTSPATLRNHHGDGGRERLPLWV